MIFGSTFIKKTLFHDIPAMYDYILKTTNAKPRKINYVGLSLGTSVWLMAASTETTLSKKILRQTASYQPLGLAFYMEKDPVTGVNPLAPYKAMVKISPDFVAKNAFFKPGKVGGPFMHPVDFEFASLESDVGIDTFSRWLAKDNYKISNFGSVPGFFNKMLITVFDFKTEGLQQDKLKGYFTHYSLLDTFF